MAQEIDLMVATFNMISFWAGILSLYFWINIYNKAKKGSIAWLLFALTSIFMVSASLFPYILIYFTDLVQEVQYTISLNFLIFWGMVYTVFFASAGYALKRDLISRPKEQAGTYLIDRLYTPERIDTAQDSSSQASVDTEADRFSKIIQGKSLLEYTSRQRYEDAVLEMVLRFWGDLRNTVIISTSPRADYYYEKLMEIVDMGAIKIINLSFAKNDMEENGYLTIPIDDISNITSALKDLPGQCSIIIDATTILLQNMPAGESSNILGEIISKSGERDLIILANENIRSKIPENIINSLNKKIKLTDNSIDVQVEKEFQSIALAMGERFYLGV